jgi:hypothetical protein
MVDCCIWSWGKAVPWIANHNRHIRFLYPDISLIAQMAFVQPSTYNFFPHLCISFCLQPLRQWKHHTLWGEFCCCVAAGSLLLCFHWFIVEFSGNRDRPQQEFASQHPPWYGGAKLRVLTQSPHRWSPQPTRLEFQPVWVWSSANVSAAISKSNVHTCEMTSVRLELQPAKSVGSSVRIMCGVGARPTSIQCGVKYESLLERGGGAVGASKVLKYLEDSWWNTLLYVVGRSILNLFILLAITVILPRIIWFTFLQRQNLKQYLSQYKSFKNHPATFTSSCHRPLFYFGR